ncbi:MAG: hypothetical protein ABH821_05420 [archaeon]
MVGSETLVRLEPAQEIIIDRLTKTGLFKTKSEVIRASILELGKEYHVFKSVQDIEDEMVVRKMQKIDKDIKKGKRKVLTEKQVKKKYGFR